MKSVTEMMEASEKANQWDDRANELIDLIESGRATDAEVKEFYELKSAFPQIFNELKGALGISTH